LLSLLFVVSILIILSIDLSEQQKMGDDFKVSGSVIKAALDESNAGLTAAQQQELMLLEQQATEREKDIIKIAQSINELATLFKELHRLIQDQGTILDRIDYNIEQTVVKVKKGRADLEVAEKHSRKALTMKCIGILGIIFLILLIIFIWKESS
jgi:syntaxin 16